MADPSTQARTLCTSIMIELPPEAGGGQMLFADIEIDCPVCGSHKVRFAGHHLKAIRDFLVATIDQYPELAGKGSDYEAVERTTFKGRANDPRRS